MTEIPGSISELLVTLLNVLVTVLIMVVWYGIRRLVKMLDTHDQRINDHDTRIKVLETVSRPNMKLNGDRQ